MSARKKQDKASFHCGVLYYDSHANTVTAELRGMISDVHRKSCEVENDVQR